MENYSSFNKSAYLKYIISVLLFGTNGVIAGFIPLPSNDIVLLRSLIGGIFVVSIFLITKSKWTFYRYKKDFFYNILSGIIIAGSWSFLYEAFHQVGVSLGTLLYYTGPVILIALSPIVFKEKLTTKKLISILIVVIGVFLINRGIGDSGGSLFGIFCGLMAAVCYTLMIIAGKKVERIPGLEKSVIQMIVTFLTVAVLWLIRNGLSFHFGNIPWLPVLLLGSITGIASYLYFSTLSELPAQTISISGYLEPLSAVVLSVLILKEQLFPLQVLGAVFILGGAIFAEMANLQK